MNGMLLRPLICAQSHAPLSLTIGNFLLGGIPRELVNRRNQLQLPREASILIFKIRSCTVKSDLKIKQRIRRMSENPSHHYFSIKYCKNTSNLFCNTPPICIAVLLVPPRSVLLPFVSQYASHLHCNTPPICIAVRLGKILVVAVTRMFPKTKSACLSGYSFELLRNHYCN